MKKVLLTAVFGILYLLWEFVPSGAITVQAGERNHRPVYRQTQQRHDNRTYHPQPRIYLRNYMFYVPKPSHEYPWYPVYRYPQPPVVIERERVVIVERPVLQQTQVQPQEQYRSGLFLNGGSPEVQAAVKKELLDKKVLITTDRSIAASELKIAEKIIGDPWFRIDLELIDLTVNRTVSASDGSYKYKSRSEWGKLEAIREAAHVAVGSLKYL